MFYVHAPSLTGRTRSFEEALNVLLCLVRGELSSSTRGLVGGGFFRFSEPSLHEHTFKALCIHVGQIFVVV